MMRLIASMAALASSACAATPAPPAPPAPAHEIALQSETREISGWFSAGGEWALYPNKLSRPYEPHTSNENAKCVSIVNGTGGPRSAVRRFHGKRVVVRGYATEYDKLPTGDSAVEKLLSKKTFGKDVVENFCLRRYVFVATGLSKQ
jgi:hypothetical protein